MATEIAVRTCSVPWCDELLDWEGPPDLCVIHFDRRVDTPQVEEVPPEPPRNRVPAHAGDLAGADMARAAYPALTERQALSLMAFARTGSQSAAAYEMGVSKRTVTNHLNEVYAKLEVAGIAQALYRVFGVEQQVTRREIDLHAHLLESVRQEWLDEALRRAAEAAMQAAIESIDLRLYKAEMAGESPVTNREEAEG